MVGAKHDPIRPSLGLNLIPDLAVCRGGEQTARGLSKVDRFGASIRRTWAAPSS